MTCWVCRCHTLTSRKEAAKIIGLFQSSYCRQDTTTCKGEKDTKILEKLRKYILFMRMAIGTNIHTVFSRSWCICHYTAPILWSSSVIQISCFIPVHYSLQWQKLTATFSQNKVNQMTNQDLVSERKKKKEKILGFFFFLIFFVLTSGPYLKVLSKNYIPSLSPGSSRII